MDVFIGRINTVSLLLWSTETYLHKCSQHSEEKEREVKTLLICGTLDDQEPYMSQDLCKKKKYKNNLQQIHITPNTRRKKK